MQTKVNILLISMALTLCISCKVIKPGAPTTDAINIPAPRQITSEIDIPVNVELASYIRQAESEVPAEYGGGENPCEGIRYSYLVQRSPFIIEGNGQVLNLSFEGRYRIGGEYCAKCVFGKCVVPKPGFSCGTGGESMRRVWIGYSSRVGILPHYRLQTGTNLTALNPIDRCRITFLNYDITDKIMNGVRGRLQSLGAKVDEKTAAIDLKPNAQRLWQKLFTEQSLNGFGFLNINPQSMRFSGLNMNGTGVSFSFGLSCKPVVSTKSEPVPATDLPDLSITPPANGFYINLDLKAANSDITNHLRKVLNGKSIQVTKRKKITITNTSFYGIGNSKVVVAIQFKGSRKGTLYFTGTPVYNSITNTLSFPDLDFDLKTRNLLLQIAKWLLNKKITAFLQEKAKYDLTPVLENAKTKLQKELNRNLGDNIEMTGTVKDLNIQAIYPTSQDLLFRVRVNGNVSVSVK